MGYIIDLSERGGDVRRFEDGLKKAKHGLAEAYEIWEDMKNELRAQWLLWRALFHAWRLR